MLPDRVVILDADRNNFGRIAIQRVILNGYFYNYLESNRKGCLHKSRKGVSDHIMSVESVLYVGNDLAVEKNMFILSMSDHEDLSTGLQPKMMSYHHKNAISIVCIF